MHSMLEKNEIFAMYYVRRPNEVLGCGNNLACSHSPRTHPTYGEHAYPDLLKNWSEKCVLVARGKRCTFSLLLWRARMPRCS